MRVVPVRIGPLDGSQSITEIYTYVTVSCIRVLFTLAMLKKKKKTNPKLVIVEVKTTRTRHTPVRRAHIRGPPPSTLAGI